MSGMGKSGIKTEQARAEEVSAAVDRVLAGLDERPGQVEPADTGLIGTARYLAAVVQGLGVVDPALEQRIAHIRQRQRAIAPARRLPRLRLAWVVAALAVLLLAIGLLTPLGQTAVASFLAVFNLGRTEVQIAPAQVTTTATAAAGSTAVVEALTLEQAQAQVSFAIPQPAYLPPGYRLLEVHSYTYPDLPAWIPQPLCIELVYGDGRGDQAALHLYPITLGDRANISGLNLGASPIKDVRDVDVDGKPGVLLSLGAQGTEAIWQELVWEQGDLILSLSAAGLGEDELMRIARSVQ